jgi:hypothetical protein
MEKFKNNKFWAIALIILAMALGAQSCSEKDDEQKVAVTGITVAPESADLLVGDTITLVAEVFPAGATDKSVTWKSDNESVAKVANGLVTAIAVGEANITVTSVANSEKTAICAVKVRADFTVSLNESALVELGAKRKLSATITPESLSQNVSWSSSNENVLRVGDNGILTPVTLGEATVTATLTVANTTKTAECVVTVLAAIAADSLKGRWTFEDVADLGKATVGDDLVASEEYGVFASIDGPDNTKAVRITEDGYYTVYHNIGANGGGENTNEYTLMMDIRGSEDEFAGWLSLYDNGFVDDDGYGLGSRLWIDGDGAIGFAPLGGYSEPVLTPDTWHRVVIAVKLGESFKVYVDGELAFTASAGTEVDGEFSLYPEELWIGYEFSEGYPGPEFAELRVWSVALTAEQIAALGVP